MAEEFVPTPEELRLLAECRRRNIDLTPVVQVWRELGDVDPLDPEPALEHLDRWDHQLIMNIIPAGSAVLDCGCGSGELLSRLIREKGVYAQGIEIDPDLVIEALDNGVHAIQVDLDEGMVGFADDSFDFVVLEETLQTVYNPLKVLQEMVRVGHWGIVSFPNFAHWRSRMQLGLLGRMPQTKALPYSWHGTPNIHHVTVDDFLDLCKQLRLRIVQAHARRGTEIAPLADGDNLLADEVLFVLSR